MACCGFKEWTLTMWVSSSNSSVAGSSLSARIAGEYFCPFVQPLESALSPTCAYGQNHGVAGFRVPADVSPISWKDTDMPLAAAICM